MQLVTRCPDCSTLFKVVPDQIKISQGWVRCGQCQAIFEAATHFVQTKSEAIEVEGGIKNAMLNIADYDQNTLTSGKIMHKKVDAPPELASKEPPSVTQPAPPVPVLASSPETVEPARLQEHAVHSPPPDFMRDAQRAARWRKPWVRATLFLVAMVFLLVLAAQLALHERARIAAVEPQTLPWLEKLCQIERYTRGKACSVGAFAQIESIVVDASGFSKLRADANTETYRLAVSLKNTSAISLAMPAVEISLTDSQEQVLLRRVLRAEDMGSSGLSQPILPAKGEFSGAASFTVDTAGLLNSQGLPSKITGYRLLAFYP